MQNIVLITRENSERTTRVAVFLCNRYDEASLFSGFINHLALADGERLFARRVLMGNEYDLEKQPRFTFEDLVNIDDRVTQRLLRDVNFSVLGTALSGASEAVQNKIFRNMSRRAAGMLQEDIEFMGNDHAGADAAQRVIIDAYYTVRDQSDERIKSAFAAASRKNKKTEEKTNENSDDNFWVDYDKEKTYIVMVMRGIHELADRISVMLFDTEESANNCREFMNTLKPADGSFIYARRVEQMVEYEIEKPLLVRFDQIFDYENKILETALAKVGHPNVIVDAIKGLDMRSREKILTSLPAYMEEQVISSIETLKDNSKKIKYAFSDMLNTKLARQCIVDTMIAIEKKIRKEPCPVEKA
jgi:hypothetical protein